MADQSKNKFDFKSILVIVLTVVLIAVVVMFVQQRNEHNLIVTQLNSEKDSIKVELTNMLINYDSLKTNNESLNQNLLTTQAEIKDL